MRYQGAKELTADRFIASFGQPPAVLVAASEVEAKSNFGKALHDRVVQFHSESKPFF